MAQNAKPSIQDFSLIRTTVDHIKETFGLSTSSNAFYFFVLDLFFNLQEDEIDDAITDNNYLGSKSRAKGHDRGIDAIYIDSNETPNVIHLFNFKYTDIYKNIDTHFPSNEVDKILLFLFSVMQQEDSLEHEVNPQLFSKVREIWNIFEKQNPKFVIHLCSNFANGLEENEKKRFEKGISKYSNFSPKYHTISDFVLALTHRDYKKINARVRCIDRNLFEKSDGDIRALIIDIDARDLIRMVLDSKELREAIDLDNFDKLKGVQITEDAFKDNVRIYLQQRSRINRNIKDTALSEESCRFFYFNNGITITCDKYSYPKGMRNPIVDIENLQIVNGSQTVHALHDAFQTDASKFENIDILCRVYETSNSQLSTNIAEYTNSQNPVKTRDVRSNDYVQKKLEKELFVKGYFYERKKSQFHDKPKQKRIDAEKTGQVLMAFFNKLPAEAKDAKRLVFAEKYDEVFSDEITADSVLFAISLFDKIESEKSQTKRRIIEDDKAFESESFILHASYYILYVIRLLAEQKGVKFACSNFIEIWKLYNESVSIIKQTIEIERAALTGFKEKYTHRMFFKGNRPKKHIECLLKKDDGAFIPSAPEER